MRFVLDANVILGLLNKKDAIHEVCKAFFDELQARRNHGEHMQIILPAHHFFEVNMKMRRLKRAGKWDDVSSFEFGTGKGYPLDSNFMTNVDASQLYDKFNMLKANDAIYAAVAYLEKAALFTHDRDFESVKGIIDVRFIDSPSKGF